MIGLRILIVTRQYWPLCDDATLRLAELATGLRRMGTQPTVVTARLAAAWPEEIVHREVPVIRPVTDLRGGWAHSRYLRALSKWLREHIGSYDVAYADAMREEGALLVESAHSAAVPVVLRCGGAGDSADPLWWQAVRGGRRIWQRCLTADALVATRAASAQQMLAAGAPADRVIRIEEGIARQARPSDASRGELRHALADVNADLCVPRGGRVIALAGQLNRFGGAAMLVRAAGGLLSRWPRDRYWIIGDGPSRAELYEEIKQAGLLGAVLMPGSFDHTEDVLHAADCFVAASPADCLDHHLPVALAFGCPVVAADTPEMRSLIQPGGDSASWFSPGSVDDLRTVLGSVLADLPAARRRAERLRAQILAARSHASNLEAHLRLFRRLAAARRIAAGAGVAS